MKYIHPHDRDRVPRISKKLRTIHQKLVRLLEDEYSNLDEEHAKQLKGAADYIESVIRRY